MYRARESGRRGHFKRTVGDHGNRRWRGWNRRRDRRWWWNGSRPGAPSQAPYGGPRNLIQLRLARWTSLPSAMNPHPLIGMLPNDLFDCGVEALRVGNHISGHLQSWIEPEYVALLLRVPQREPRNNGRLRAIRELYKARSGTRQPAEKIDEDTLRGRGVLIDQNADGAVAAEGFHHRSRCVSLIDQMIARQGAAPFHEMVDQRIVQRPHHNVHRLGHQRVRKGAQLPIAQMTSGNQDAAALPL